MQGRASFLSGLGVGAALASAAALCVYHFGRSSKEPEQPGAGKPAGAGAGAAVSTTAKASGEATASAADADALREELSRVKAERDALFRSAVSCAEVQDDDSDGGEAAPWLFDATGLSKEDMLKLIRFDGECRQIVLNMREDILRAFDMDTTTANGDWFWRAVSKQYQGLAIGNELIFVCDVNSSDAAAFANVCKFLDSLASGWEQAERHLEALGQTAVVLFPAPGAAIPDSISPPGKDVAFPVMHVSRLIASIEGVDAEC